MFTHLHTHTEFSLLDGACRIGQLAKRAKSLGMQSLAITDHGNMFGAVDFYKACKKEGIKAIIGCEVYVSSRTRFDKEKDFDKDYNHLILLCKNETGYKNLINMVSKSYTQGFYFKPRIDHDLLEQYHDGLICLSACLAGEIPQALLQKDYEKAKHTALRYNDIFGSGNYYLEIQDHSIPEQKIVIEGIKRLSRELDIPVVATNDVHYIEKKDAQTQQVLICIATNHIIGDDTGMEFHGEEFYLKSEDEMRELFSDIPQAVDNTQLIADKCNFEFEFGNTKLPYFETPGNMDHFEYFKSLCLDGMKKRYGENPSREYYDRLSYELETVEKMGYTDYYLIVADFVSFAKSRGIPVGPGRGSGAGSIAAYCMGITDVDPMKYNLLFERFLNPERVSMPDFDIDFCYERRGEVIDYVTKKYGADHVAQIVTFGTLAARAAIRDVGRAMGIDYSQVDTIAKLIPNELHITIEQAVEKSKELSQAMEKNSRIKNLVETAMQVEGMPRNASTHPAGVVITHNPVSDYVPLATNDGVPVTQYIMTTLEELGLLKMDFLGLRTLTVIDSACTSAGIDADSIESDDAQTFELFAKGKTEGVFQFESSGMKQMLINLKPTALEDLIAAISLYRPGPAKQINTFVENSHNPERITYITPKLKPILENTYGCMVYQEQVMQIFRELAGYSYGRADVVRRAMSKKKLDVMEQERGTFIAGCGKNGIDKSTADIIFDRMADFAKYAFNKSHAVCYALVAYTTAYLKCHYPAEFMAALMTSVLDQSNKIARYTAECKRLGLRLAPPDINISMKGFTVNADVINYGLLGIKNVGSDFVDEIVEQRKNGKFKDLVDFCRRMQGRHFNKRAVESLIRCGALDCFSANRRQMIQALPAIVTNLEVQRQSTRYGQVGFFDIGQGGIMSLDFDIPDVPEFSKNELLNMEKEMTGLYLSGHPMDKYAAVCEKLRFANTLDLIDAGKDANTMYKDKSRVRLCGIIVRTTLKQTRNGSQMAFVTIEDLYGSIEIIVFAKTLERFSQYIYDSSIISVSGTLSVEDNKDSKVIADEIGPAAELNNVPDKPKSSKKRGLFLRFNDENDDKIRLAKRVTSIFEGNTPLYFYYIESGKYELQPKSDFVEVNDTEIRELKRILGDENVVYKN